MPTYGGLIRRKVENAIGDDAIHRSIGKGDAIDGGEEIGEESSLSPLVRNGDHADKQITFGCQRVTRRFCIN